VRMMKILIVFVATFLLVASSDDCEYMETTSDIALNVTKVKNCFNSYKVPMDFVEAVIKQVELFGELYPYVDIAKNPPENMRSFFKPFDFAKELETLKKTLRDSEGVSSQVFRPLVHLFGAFYDGHTAITFKNTDSSNNMFADVLYCFPFAWIPYVDEGETRVKLQITGCSFYDPDYYYALEEKISSGLYATKIDNEDAFEYLKNFHKETSYSKSLQGILYKARVRAMSYNSMLYSPLEDKDFDEHTIEFSDGSKLSFTFVIFRDRSQAKQALKAIRVPDDHAIDWDEQMRSMREQRINRDYCPNQYVFCNTSEKLNVIHVGGFSIKGDPKDYSRESGCFSQQLMDCTTEIDKNGAPVVVSLLGNGGGSEFHSRLMSYLLFPDYNNDLVKAFRITDESKVLKSYVPSSCTITTTCEPITQRNFDSFMKNTVVDDLGNGVKHKRSEKYYENYPLESDEQVRKSSIHNYPRKPTDVVVVTDGVCASACSMLVKSVLDNGAGIVAGVGITYDGNEKFTASQIAANNLASLTEVIPDLADECEKYGFNIGLTVLEHYSNTKDLEGVIPREYSLDKIDVNMGEFDFPYQINKDNMEIALAALEVSKDFKTSCNPDNKNLLMVNDKCEIKDKNALKMGYGCGSDGHWDENDCRIALCKPGYIVDFSSNTCVYAECIPSASSTSSISSTASISDRAVLNGFTLVVSALLFLVIH